MTFQSGLVIINKRRERGRKGLKIYEYSENIAIDFSAAVVALGLFDGVHVGHRALLSIAKREAEKRHLPLAVFTFFQENNLPKGTTRLYSNAIKTELLEKMGVEYVIYADFDKISGTDARSFITDILVGKLKAELAVTGLDFRFGKGRCGDTRLLSDVMRELNKECLSVPDKTAEGKKISTSLIKELLKGGNPRLAAKLLGEAYFIEGEIVHGDGRGETLGLPTVNISLQNNQDFIKTGVYLSKVTIGEKSYTGLTNIGVCPTFEAREVHAETFILDFSDKVYGKLARIHLFDYLREEKKFNSKEELTKQIMRDVASAKERSQDVR